MPKVSSQGGPPRKQGINRSAHSMNPERSTEGLKGVAKVRTKATIKRLQMYRNFKAKRDKTGKILTPAPFQVRRLLFFALPRITLAAGAIKCLWYTW